MARRPVKKIAYIYLLFVLLFLLSACAHPLPKTLALERPPRLGIIGFKMTAPIKKLSSIVEAPPENLSRKEKAALLDKDLRDIEARASFFLIGYLDEEKKIEPVLVPEGFAGTSRGEAPSISQIAELKRDFGLDAVIYGEIPWYGKTRLLYPILGESLDITAESVVLGFATGWNAPIIFGNIGFELLTSTPLWFGGAYLFGVAFRPVSVDATVLSAENGKVVWQKSVDRIMPGKILKSYPESERSKKEVQLEASLKKAVRAIAASLSGVDP